MVPSLVSWMLLLLTHAGVQSESSLEKCYEFVAIGAEESWCYFAFKGLQIHGYRIQMPPCGFSLQILGIMFE